MTSLGMKPGEQSGSLSMECTTDSMLTTIVTKVLGVQNLVPDNSLQTSQLPGAMLG